MSLQGTNIKYCDFIREKHFKSAPSGFDADLSAYPQLFDYQRDITKWALSRGKSAIFADTGLGKTLMQLVWANEVAMQTGGNVLILAPLAVSQQTIIEGNHFGISVNQWPSEGVSIINYEQLHNIDPSIYVGVVLDESSILKGMNGKVRRQITDAFIHTPYRLSCTATPSPNDFMELGTQSEFLGIMSQVEMLATFFIHDGSDTAKWRLKGHGRRRFFEWLATWAVFISCPSDLGYEPQSDLPELIYHEYIVDTGITDGLLPAIAQGLSERLKARRQTVDMRVELAASIANSIDDQVLVWCNLNDESELLTAAVHDAVEVKGADKPEHKELAAKWFTGHNITVLNGKLLEASACRGNLNTQREGKKSTTLTLNTKQSASSNPEILKREGITCANMQNLIERSLEEPLSSKPNTTGSVGRSTQLIKDIASERRQRSQNIKGQTLKKDLHKGLKNTESRQNSTDQCLHPKAAVAPYAGQSTLDAQRGSACTSITATNQERLEGFFAQTAIKGSESLRMTQIECEEQQDTSRRVLISKPRIFGYGLNFQSCNQIIFVGLSDSWEQFYQSVRRCWRYGQKRAVHVHIVSADIEGAVLANIKEKERKNNELKKEMINIMRGKTLQQLGKASSEVQDYKTTVNMELPSWIK